MLIENVYTSIACNRTPESADWGNNGLIVFGACNSISILDPKFQGSAKITHTFVQHTKRVNTVQWVREESESKETQFVSGSDDFLAILWDITDITQPKTYPLKGHESGVNAVSTVFQNAKLLVATASADSSVKLWKFKNGKSFECTQTIHLKSGFCFAIRMTLLPNSSHILLAYASDDDSISIWANVNNEEPDTFSYVHKLKGHEDWVRSLDITTINDDLLLSSSSQDNFIRLWRISPRSREQVQNNKIDIFNLEEDGEIHVEENIIQLGSCSESTNWYAVTLESVLYGHEGWVYAVHWHNRPKTGLKLLSASIDKTLIIWEQSEDGIWMEKVRTGEIGGNTLGFFGGKFSSDGKSILGHSYQGGFHIWNQAKDNDNIWMPNVIVGGHFGEVRDLCWEPKGHFLVTVSSDQTSRIHAPWVRKENSITWHELARPQVHGYDMQTVAILSRYTFASGAEEKIVRTFQAAKNFIEDFRKLSNILDDVEGDIILESLPKGASVPSLGLSNKAVYNCDAPDELKHVKDQYPENYFTPITLHEPPQEETLMQNTLWPEMQKLYGHGFEIFALAASPDGKVLASSCKATNAEHAQIILWNTKTWKQFQKLPSHNLTVTQMKFSPNNKYLLSVSRDRRWALFEKNSQSKLETTASIFQLHATSDKSNGIHTRIIWSCDWSHDSQLFATSSRDGKVVVWKKSDSDSETKTSLNGWTSFGVLELKSESITAVAFSYQTLEDESYLLALGLDSGIVHLFRFNGEWTQCAIFNNNMSHHLTVRKLQFRPTSDAVLQLASCGDDHLVRIYQINL